MRNGAKVRRIYHQPATPSARLLEHPEVDNKIKDDIHLQKEKPDPLQLLHRIRKSQAALSALALGKNPSDSPRLENLNQFLSELPRLWKSGEVRPTHRKTSKEPRYWQTRKKPFEGVWLEVLERLRREPDATAKVLFERLQKNYPGRFASGQPGTLQRRM